VGVDWLLYTSVISRTIREPESMLRSSNSTPRCTRKFLTQPHGRQSCCVKTMTLDCGMLLRQRRFAVGSTQHAVNSVWRSLLWLVEMTHLQLAQKPQGDQLHASDDQYRGEY